MKTLLSSENDVVERKSGGDRNTEYLGLFLDHESRYDVHCKFPIG